MQKQVPKLQRPNPAMGEKLISAFESGNGTFTGTKKGVDGVDHINIGRGSKTVLGGWLSQYREDRFKHNVLGFFNSIDRVRVYLVMVEKNDMVRACSNGVLTRIVKDSQRQKVTNQLAILLDAYWQRLQQAPAMMLAIKASVAPFTSYDVNPEFPLIRSQNSMVMPLLRGLEEIRTALIENRLPDFLRFYDDDQSTIEECIIKALGLTADEAFAMQEHAKSKQPTEEEAKKPKKKKKHKKAKPAIVVDEQGEVNGNVAPIVVLSEDANDSEVDLKATAEYNEEVRKLITTPTETTQYSSEEKINDQSIDAAHVANLDTCGNQQVGETL